MIPRFLPLRACALVLSLLFTGAAWASDREHEAHVHGMGHLNVAVEGNAVEMELVSPGADIVGFEHAPRTPEDKAAVKRAVALLRDGGTLFAFPAAAGCRLTEAEVESEMAEEDHDDHGHERKDGEHEDEDHSEFHAHYHFRCNHPDHLTHIDIKLFEHFPGARELDVQTVSPRGQSAAELTPGAARLKF